MGLTNRDKRRNITVLSDNAVMLRFAFVQRKITVIMGDLALKNDRETRAKLLASAKAEFLEKGYMQASLRNICKNAGVTTGALYFFFQDKEDLFASIVEEPLHGLYEIMKAHYSLEMQSKDIDAEVVLGNSEDLEAAREAIHYMYQNYDEFQLLLTKAQGSRYAQCVDQFVNITEQHYRVMADQYTDMLHTDRVEDYIIHWIAHMHIDTFVHMLTHEESEGAALRHMEATVKYLISGWFGMIGGGNIPPEIGNRAMPEK